MYLKQLNSFLVKAERDYRIGPHHISLYVALFQQWCINDGKNPVSITQIQLKQIAKIGRTTYHKCMRELASYGFIKYVPSYSSVLGSLVYLGELE